MEFFLICSLIVLTISLIVLSEQENTKYKLICLRNEQFTIHHQMKEGFAKIKVGGNAYKVHEDLENPVKAAETMDRLNTVAHKLIDHLQQKYLKESSISTINEKYKKIVHEGIIALKANFKTANLQENVPARSGGDTSYVIDKGSVFAMCLRDPQKNNKLDDKFNDLVFVLIHEMAHLFTSTFGHDNLFWNNFKFLLQEAIEANLYQPVDYKKTGSPYCGIVVTYSPLYDKALKSYYI